MLATSPLLSTPQLSFGRATVSCTWLSAIGVTLSCLASAVHAADTQRDFENEHWQVTQFFAATVSATYPEPEGRPHIILNEGRIRLAVQAAQESVTLSTGLLRLSTELGTCLIEHYKEGSFVVVLSGTVLLRSEHSSDPGILLQSRQGIGTANDGLLADVLTFGCAPDVEDPTPLAEQAQRPDDGRPWPLTEDAPPDGDSLAELPDTPTADDRIIAKNPEPLPVATDPNTENNPEMPDELNILDTPLDTLPAEPALPSADADSLHAPESATNAAPQSVYYQPAWQHRGRR